ncbi:acyl-CoA dehydrogenase family protein [Nonomuraea sp. NBC_01738]|uniref:acyl-CoA dehydrogenase family protein n=1 Tax=Nonomuraea sp. NBC_01738 TaxID=2976003 RepID=UPI002E0DB840|nr:acyl-CoA dehydrogenase family protein [Nonomuraea sp. NBC_01738]
MDLDFTPAEQDFRAEVRDWLAAHVPRELPSMDTRAGFAAHRAWEARLAADRLSVVSWPGEYGGRDATLIEWLIFEEEYWAAGAPGRVTQNGIFLLAPTLMRFGTREQRERLLPRMAAADDVWAQAWSEPEAGSDLAALTSRAERVDGGWLLHGHKTWSSRAAYASHGFGLFRTSGARHKGLTYFLFPLAEVTVRPIAQLDGEHGFAELFFDGVFVPDAMVLGAEGEGWRIAMATTSSERGLALRSPGRFLATAARLLALPAGDPVLADRAARCWIDAEAYRLHTFATARRLMAGAEIGAAASMGKVFWSELDLRMHTLAMEILGERAGTTPWLDGFLFSLAGPIYAGTNEIQRNIIAERVLGLPR